MLQLKEFFDDDIIHISNIITEVNSGYIDHPDFIRVLKEIVDKVKDELKNFETSKISELYPYISFPYTFRTYRYKETFFEPDIPIKQNIEIQIFPQKKQENKMEDLLTSGATYFDNHKFTIKIGVNNTKLVSDLLNSMNKFESIMSHELVHVFQNIYGNYKKSQAYIKKGMNSSDDNFGKWYWSNKREIEAYITNINIELRQLKKENPDIKFKSAMLKIKSWKHLNDFMPKEGKNLIARILRKVVHYWQHNLGGKLNEFTYRLK